MKIEGIHLTDLKNGFMEDANSYCCLVCNTVFDKGEIFAINDRLFEAKKAMRMHMATTHTHYLHTLIEQESKYNSLTPNQKLLLKKMAQGLSDKEIARDNGVTPSTIRHQRFMFREKAKQARYYLAQYESVFEAETDRDSALIPIPNNAKKVDERYAITNAEYKHVLETAFSSLSPLILKQFSPKEKKKIVILTKIAEQFDANIEYTQKEINEKLSAIYSDYITIRRYLIEYGFMQRTKDGRLYWLTR